MSSATLATASLLFAVIASSDGGGADVATRGGKQVGDVLVVTLGNGKAVNLTDLPVKSHGDGARSHTYVSYLPAVRQHLVQVRRWEGSYFIAIDDLSGAQVDLPGPPVVSPDGRWIASVASSGEPYGLEREEIWAVGGTGGLKLAYRASGAGRIAKWLDAKTLRLESPADSFYGPQPSFTIRFVESRWVATVE